MALGFIGQRKQPAVSPTQSGIERAVLRKKPPRASRLVEVKEPPIDTVDARGQIADAGDRLTGGEGPLYDVARRAGFAHLSGQRAHHRAVLGRLTEGVGDLFERVSFVAQPLRSHHEGYALAMQGAW